MQIEIPAHYVRPDRLHGAPLTGWLFFDTVHFSTEGRTNWTAHHQLDGHATEDELPELAANAYLFLWRVASQVEEAYSLVRAAGMDLLGRRVQQSMPSPRR